MTHHALDADMSTLERSALDTLENRWQRGETLSGLRCGTAVCESVLALAARDRLTVTRVERDGGDWVIDVERP
ncbi:MAG: hypothetical protein SVW77_02755 [Candidatus Nanohaloarchaea archaeon]|nr:hypothetical protein [Candidatus Nanohaloarchaea archaeon]